MTGGEDPEYDSRIDSSLGIAVADAACRITRGGLVRC